MKVEKGKYHHVDEFQFTHWAICPEAKCFIMITQQDAD